MKRLRIALALDEGWLSLGLVALMALTAAWSIDDAGWVLGRRELTHFLPWTALLGVLVGFVGSKVGWNRWLAHTIGAVFAALIVPVIVGTALPQLHGGSPGALFVATATATVNAWSDLIVNKLLATRETGHHLLVLGLLCWATGQFAASAVFRHRRPLSAVVVIGAILVANMAATVRNQLSYLILFSLASLFLLIRLHALDEQATWTRRRIGDPTAVRSIYLRGGTVFIFIAVIGSVALTTTARSAPLAGAWDDIKPMLLDVGAAVQRFLPAGGDNRGIGGVQFGPTAVIQDVWNTNGSLSLTIRRVPGDNRPYYWRAAAYDRFNFIAWDWTDEPTRTNRPAGEELLAGMLDAPVEEGTKEVIFTVTPADYRGSYALSPLAPVKVNRDTQLLSLGEDGFFEALQIEGHEPYELTARVPLLGDDPPGSLTQNVLRVAGTNYPDEIRARYLQVPTGTIGAEAQAVLDEVLAKTADNPYDVAAAMVRELQGPGFHYDANVSDVDCGDRSAAECFAMSRRGACLHYATLMTILLREHKIPARFVQGFLPGDLNALTGVEEIANSSAHAWVEVYFPRYGWVIFDPTGGNLSQAEALPTGKPVAGPAPTPVRSISPDDDEGPDAPGGRSQGAGGGTTTSPGGGNGAGPFIIVSLLLLGVVAGLAFLAWQRGPRGPTTPDGVYAGVARLAARFGFGPRPTQTAYEFAAALGDVLPNVRPELETVATAKVETAYGRRTLDDERIRALRESYLRLRVGLLRLLLRRRNRRRR